MMLILKHMVGFEIKGQIHEQSNCLWTLVCQSGYMGGVEEVMRLTYAFVFIRDAKGRLIWCVERMGRRIICMYAYSEI